MKIKSKKGSHCESFFTQVYSFEKTNRSIVHRCSRKSYCKRFHKVHRKTTFPTACNFITGTVTKDTRFYHLNNLTRLDHNMNFPSKIKTVTFALF